MSWSYCTSVKKKMCILSLTRNGNNGMCNLADYPDKLGPHEANSDSAPAWRYVFFDFFSSRFFFLPGSLNLYQSLVHWSRLASAFCCRLNRLVLDDRSKILTTSGERRDAQPVRERRRPDRSTGLRRLGCTIRQGESHGSQRWSIR